MTDRESLSRLFWYLSVINLKLFFLIKQCRLILIVVIQNRNKLRYLTAEGLNNSISEKLPENA